MLEGGIQSLQLAVKLTPHVACTVDSTPSRAVHCLELSATCPSDRCKSVHFGYAIPVYVKEFIEEGLAELILEDSAELSPSVAEFLLTYHPQLRSMATTATAATKPVRCEPDEDIAAIAKQISDHAEAIYQTWKSRGLAPADILTCHNNETAADKFGTALTPQPLSAPRSPSIELLAQAPTMDNNRLERLVNNFVSEDKARLAAAKSRQSPITTPPTGTVTTATNLNKPMPSSIQYALQKFEKNFQQPSSVSPTSSQQQQQQQQHEQKPIKSINNSELPSVQKVPISNNSIRGPKPQIYPKPQFPIADTIEYTLPIEMKRQQQQQSQMAPSNLQTWPLKNRVVNTDNVKQRAITEIRSNVNNATPINNHNNSSSSSNNNNNISNNKANNFTSNNATTAIDQVALEEKRLINALKNGVILSSDERINHNSTTPNKILVNTKVTSISNISGGGGGVSNSSGSSINNSVSDNNIISSSSSSSTNDRNPDTITRWGPRTSIGRRSEHQPAPHPELTNIQRQHLRHVQQAQTSPNPVRPFLTRGSVAERVLIFERCPSELLLDKRPRAPAAPKCQPPVKQLSAHTTLQRHVKANRNVLIPRFYYPQGKPIALGQLDGIKVKVQQAFTQHADRINRDQFVAIVQACELPMYWKIPLYLAAGGDCGFVTKDKFLNFWTQMVNQCHDAASRFAFILTRGKRNWLSPEDFIPLIQDVVETHPGLTFLKEAAEFHSRYVHTVIARIFYCVNRSWSGRINLSELRRSNLLSILQLLEEEEDINQITAYFSYEHFYVIYCKFWELDRDHDLFIDKQDLTRHNDHALSTRIIDRIFSGAVTRGGNNKQHHKQQQQQQEEKMSYTEFVWFLLSEEDKTHPTAIEYWFRCMDLDGDGFLSMYELEYFYEEQIHRMEAIGIETLPFQDCLCQMLDMVKPTVSDRISLSDLKRCKMTSIFFDTFFNLEKYLDHEQRDPFASQRDHDGADGQEMSDWDRYAAEEYELLVAEEGNGDNPDSVSLDEKIGDDDDDDDILSPNLDVVLNEICDPTFSDDRILFATEIHNNDNEDDGNDDNDIDDDDDDDDGDDDDDDDGGGGNVHDHHEQHKKQQHISKLLLNENNIDGVAVSAVTTDKNCSHNRRNFLNGESDKYIKINNGDNDDDDDDGDYAPDSDDCSI